MKTHVPEIEFTANGVKLPSELSILNGVLADFNQAFGGSLNLNLETPQGQLASSLAAMIANKNNQIAWIVNQVHPDYAEGLMQDALAKIYFLERKQATESSVECEFTGLAGTVIPKGFVVQDGAGNNWTLQNEISILSEGSVRGILTFSGSLKAKAHTVNRIHQTVTGLDRVDNPHDGTEGIPTESRADFRDRRHQSVAINAHGTPQAVYANVFALDGVRDVFVVDNPKNTQENIGGYTLKPHSLYVAVVGGDNLQIGKTILQYAGCGCDLNGNTEVIVHDENYTAPQPRYEVRFMRPENLPVYFRIKVEQGAPIGFQAAIKAALLKAFDEGRHARIGGTIYAMRFVSAALGATAAHILDVEIGTDRNRMGNSIKANIDQKPVLLPENIEVVIHV